LPFFAHGPVNGSRTPILISSANADLTGMQAKPAASATQEPARKKACNRLIIDVSLFSTRVFIESCGRLIVHTPVRG
jgi:hypothetical protein